MNLKNKKLIALFVCISVFSIICVAAGNALLSPALSHMEKQLSMKKCSVDGENVSFTAEDFDSVLCSDVEFIKIEKLPDSESGSLNMGSLRLAENQIVERDDLDKLVFCPGNDVSGDASFVFSNATSGESQLSAECVIHFLEEENGTPVAEDMWVSTYENISVFKFLSINDPEDDELTFEVISYPQKGTLRINEGSEGYFSYTPIKGFTGKDSFEYMVADRYGNKSKIAKVTVNVSEKEEDIYFDDLSGHWAHNAAIKTALMGLMCGNVSDDGKNLFKPKETVSRGDFLAMALISAGKEPLIEFVTETSFADDADIPMNIKSYAEYAKKCGIVTGYTDENGNTGFNSNDPITRAEAAVILERILEPDTEGADINVFADSAAVPDWASASISKLTECGVFNGTGFGEIMPHSHVTRAETAEILCNVSTFVKA